MSQGLERFRSRRDEPWLDVWSRTEPRYRIRAVVLLIVTGLLFAGLCVFAFWLRTGVYAPWQYSGYWSLQFESFNPIGARQITLVDFLLFPISVEDVPIQIVIMGLLLASMASVPILVAILYRLPYALIFCAMIAALALMPWYGATIALGSVVASGRLFKLRFRYALAILGLIPVVVYFVMATRRPPSAVSLAGHGSILYLPWVLAVLGSCVICGVALWIARLINYRPGGIAPLLAVLFAVPVLLFHFQVGRDELEYRLLESQFGPASTTRFISVDLLASESDSAERAWKEAKDRLFASILRGNIAQRATDARQQLAIDRDAAVAACDEFMEYFPHSRYVPCVLLIKARAIDLRIDAESLLRFDRIEFTWDVPTERSRLVWQTLASRFPESDPAATGLNRLAIYALREGDLRAAELTLNTLIARFDARGGEVGRDGRQSLIARRPAWSGLGLDVATEVRQARRTAELIAATAAELPTPFDPLAADLGTRDGPAVHPLAALYALDPHHPDYSRHLANLARAFPWSAIRSTVVARLARRADSLPAQVEWLGREVAQCAGRPGCGEVMLQQAEALHEASRFLEASRAYERVRDAYPQSCWAEEARERLVALAMMSDEEPG